MSDPLGAFLTGLVGEEGGGGFRGGYEFRQGIQDRRRRMATEEENATYQRALRLRQDVAAQLDQRVREGQLRAQEREAQQAAMTQQQTMAHQQGITAAAMRLRANPNLPQELKDLPDEQLVTGAAQYVIAQTRPKNLDPNSPEALMNRREYGPPPASGQLTANQRQQQREQEAEGALQGFFLRYPKFSPSKVPAQQMLQFLRNAGYGDIPEGALYGIIQRQMAAAAKAGGGGPRIDLNAVRLPGQ